MKINELNDEVFYDFASRKMGMSVSLFKSDLRFKKTENRVSITFYIGGEAADERKFIFKDDVCEYCEGTHGNVEDMSRQWVSYLANEVCESDEEANYFIDKYNAKIDARINNYAKQQVSLKIV